MLLEKTKKNLFKNYLRRKKRNLFATVKKS